ncbi:MULTISPECIES: DUF6783 domain-containing protein [Blautia]|jgi:hypothetical protein|uniref:DUF6783 domain-containing protein n=1 Tax=Blautia TaxID=572511 RepID=UPI0038CC11DF
MLQNKLEISPPFPAKWGMQIAGMILRARSNHTPGKLFLQACFFLLTNPGSANYNDHNERE